MRRLPAISPVIATVIIVAVALLISLAVIGYLYGILQQTQQGSVGGINYACRLLPLKATLYVKQDGCAVGLLELYLPRESQCTRVRIDYIEVAGSVRATPSPILQNDGLLSTGRTYYIVVYRDPTRNKVYYYPATSESLAVSLVNRALSYGRCIAGFETGMNYPGSIVWGARETFFTWVSVAWP